MWLPLFGRDALACGGFFCDGLQPVEQTEEAIVFAVDGDDIVAHARIRYEGPAADFAWILPAPGIPEIFPSREILFDALDAQTSTLLSFTDNASQSDTDTDSDSDADTDLDPDASGMVDVLSIQQVGPYEGIVVDASSPEILIEWLQDNGYALPDSYTQAVTPYLTGGMNFLAIKLEKTATVGTLPPLGIRWKGERPSIPLSLTSVAAAPDLPLTVYVLGSMRAVPLSYLHVQMNPLSYDWFSRGRSWLDEVRIAVDEAGGRAFSTQYASTAPVNLGCNRNVLDGLAEITEPHAWFVALDKRGFSGDPALMGILREYLPAPPGIYEIDFYNNPERYRDAWLALAETFDPVAATAALDAQIVTPCLDLQVMLTKNPYVTRMVTVLSPEEMTVDPVFGFRADLPEISRFLDASYARGVPSGGVLDLPGNYSLIVGDTDSDGLPTDSWLQQHLEHRALVIEQLSESAPAVILADHRSDLLPSPPALPSGCGCQTEAGPGAGLLLLFAFARRSRDRT